MRMKQMIVRMPDEYFDMLTELEKKMKQSGDMNEEMIITKPAIMRIALKEYYARNMGQAKDEAYLSLLSSTMNSILDPYFVSLTALVKKMGTGLSKDIQRQTFVNQMCFDVQFTAGKLTQDKDKLQELFTRQTPYDEVLNAIAEDRLADATRKERGDSD